MEAMPSSTARRKAASTMSSLEANQYVVAASGTCASVAARRCVSPSGPTRARTRSAAATISSRRASPRGGVGEAGGCASAAGQETVQMYRIGGAAYFRGALIAFVTTVFFFPALSVSVMRQLIFLPRSARVSL